MLRSLQGLIWLLLSCSSVAQNYQKLKNCDNAIVEVSYLEVTCDANRAYYYGSGVHRSSSTCDDDDKATITVDFDVVEDLEEGSDIYMALAAYTENHERVYKSSSASLSDYVGYDCTAQGSYSFTTRVQFVSVGGYEADFVPLIRMAFSMETKGGSDLGGVNLKKCNGDLTESESGGNFSARQGRRIAIICGVTIAVIAVIAVIAGFVLVVSRHMKGSKSVEVPRKKPDRMSESDYGVMLGDSDEWSEPSKSTPFLPPDKSSSEDSNAPQAQDEEASDPLKDESHDSSQSFSATKQIAHAEDGPVVIDVAEKKSAAEEPSKALKRGPSLVRFLRRKRTKEPKA